MGPAVCVMWIAMDILMCTASIWHMCTMSMDRYFTLKYPMKYGRNKTKTMVLLKILFVWVISLAICSPVILLGFMDFRNVFNDGICVPTIPDFVIYGSLFAFYVPLSIMVLTYVLTIRILWKNQQNMKGVERRKSRPNLRKRQNGGGSMCSEYISVENSNVRHDSIQTDIRLEITFPDEDEPQPVHAVPDTVSLTASVSDSKLTESRMTPKGSRTHVLASSMTNLSTAKSTQILAKFNTASSHDDIFKYYERCRQSDQRQLRSLQAQSCVSMTSVNSMLSLAHSEAGSIYEEGDEIFEKLSQIEQEMDDYLHSHENSENESMSESESLYDKSAMKNDDDDDLSKYTNDSEDDDDDDDLENDQDDLDDSGKCLLTKANPDDSSQTYIEDTPQENGNLENNLTIKLNATGMFMYKVDYDQKPQENNKNDHMLVENDQEELSSTLQNHMKNNLDSKPSSAENSTRYLKNKDGFLKPSRFVGRKISMTSRTAWRVLTKKRKRHHSGENSTKMNGSAKTAMLPKRTASNEKKASKVLGIIFIVFVVLWTPFFVMNILIGICNECMEFFGSKPELIAIITWLGYIASLANPIIYTMFNTSFRTAFFNILTCKYRRRRHRDDNTMYLTTLTNWASDRRNTVTVTMNPYNS